MRAIVLIAVVFMGLTSYTQAQTQQQRNDAKWIFERITGVKWAADHPLILQAASLPASEVAALAVRQPQFLNVTVKEFALEMSTRDETIRLPLNDFAASVMGVVRDDTDARELLYGNFFYVGDPARIPADIPNVIANQNTLATQVLRSNAHYEALDSKTRRVDVGATLMRVNGQSLVQAAAGNVFTLAANPDPAGILTSRTWIDAHAVAGTNRRPVEFAFRQFMCLPIEQWADAAASDVRIGRDIDRFPGDDHLKFQTTCKSCHTVMDGFRGAWARWDMDGVQALNTNVANRNADNNRVLVKLNRNETVYPGGYITTDDSWVNNAIRGSNTSQFGWRGFDGRTPATSGNGVNSFGRLIANSERFSTCMAKRVFKSVCRRDLASSDLSTYVQLGRQFETSNYNLKSLFQTVALQPKCKM